MADALMCVTDAIVTVGPAVEGELVECTAHYNTCTHGEGKPTNYVYIPLVLCNTNMITTTNT